MEIYIFKCGVWLAAFDLSVAASSRYRTSSLSSCAWRETLPWLCTVCSHRWTAPPPASLHASSSFTSASLKQRPHQSWCSVSPHSSAILTQNGSQLKVRHIYIYYNITIFTYNHFKKKKKKKKNFLVRSLTPSFVDAVPMKRAELVKFALRVQRCCSAVYTDVSYLIRRDLEILLSPVEQMTVIVMTVSVFLLCFEGDILL